LFLGTPADNTRDMVAKGRPHGPKNPRRGRGIPWAKLHEDDVVAIRVALANGEPTTRLAKAYHVAQSTIWSIKVGRIWRHVEAHGAITC